MPIVKFNSVDEFCEELEKDAVAVEVDRNIVRLTNLFTLHSALPNVRHVKVLANYSVQGQIVRLEHYCGDLWGMKVEQDNEVLERAGNAQMTVKAACDRLFLELRAGSLEEG